MLPFDMCRWQVEGTKVEAMDRAMAWCHQPWTNKLSFEAIGTAAAMIAQALAMVCQSGLNDLQRLEAHRPPMVRGGVDSRVRTTITIEGEVDVMRGIQDMGAGTKRKGDQSSSISRKKPKASD